MGIMTMTNKIEMVPALTQEEQSKIDVLDMAIEDAAIELSVKTDNVILLQQKLDIALQEQEEARNTLNGWTLRRYELEWSRVDE